jgi:hypothetical protein
LSGDLPLAGMAFDRDVPTLTIVNARDGMLSAT